jgi:hypothetical protein
MFKRTCVRAHIRGAICLGGRNSRGGRGHSQFRMRIGLARHKLQTACLEFAETKGNIKIAGMGRFGPARAFRRTRGRIPNDGYHKSLSEGEGACSRTCAGRSHLPLRGKLGWMTPRPGQKKTGKRNASFGALVPKQGPHFTRRFQPNSPRLPSTSAPKTASRLVQVLISHCA